MARKVGSLRYPELDIRRPVYDGDKVFAALPWGFDGMLYGELEIRSDRAMFEEIRTDSYIGDAVATTLDGLAWATGLAVSNNQNEPRTYIPAIFEVE